MTETSPVLAPRPLSFIAARPLTVFALCYGAGIVLGAARPFHWLWAVGLLAAIFMAIVWYKLLGGKTALAAVPSFFFLGLVLASLSAYPARPAEGIYQITGTVIGQVRNQENGQTACTLGNVSIDGKPVLSKAYWTFYRSEGQPAVKLINGSRVSFSGKLYHPAPMQNPHGFDFDLYLKQRGIHFGVFGRDNMSVTAPSSFGLGSIAYDIRAQLTKALFTAMGDNAALASVMLLGANDQLPEEAREDFRITGTAHILSISGLHVAYLAAIALWLLKWLHLSPKARFFVLAALLASYSWLVGGSPPVIRSSLMLLFYLGAKLTGRAHDPLTSISAAFLLLLIFKPLDLLSPGFQLSFGAVTGMLILGDPLIKWQNRLFPGKKPKGHGRIRQYLHQQWDSFKTMPALGLAAQVGVMFPLAVWYNEVSVLGIFVNLLVIPYTALLMLSYLLALLFSPLGILGSIVGSAASLLTNLLLWSVSLAAKIPGMAVQVASPSWPIITGGIIFLFLLSPYVLCKGRRKAILLAMTLVFILGGSYLIENKAVRYTQLSVGDADAAILEDGSFTAVIDTGETGSEVADYLRGEGRSIDALILTHLHMDHAGGIQTLVDSGIKIRYVYIPDGAESVMADSEGLQHLSLLRDAGIPVLSLHKGEAIKSPRMQLTVLWPREDSVRPSQDANQTSLVAHILMDGVSLLSTGDITDEYEDYAAVTADVLKVAHHGSAGSTSSDFLNSVQPQLALISCSGTYKHPSPLTIERITQQQIPIYRTDISGAIQLTVSGSRLTVTPFIKEQ